MPTSSKQEIYKASITRESFLFYEMRTTAKLFCEGLNDEQVIKQIVQENLFQYPTEKSIRTVARACVSRLKAMDDSVLIESIASSSQDIAKQICLYAMMKSSRLVSDFMVTVIGEKYRLQDLRFNQLDVNVFFFRLQEQSDVVAAWSESTVKKLKQVLIQTLVLNEYLDNRKSDHLNPVLLSYTLENAMREHGDEALFPAFNYFE